MTRPTKESLRYCILLLALLTTGAIAVGVTINFLDNAVPDSNNRLILTAAIWTLTLGFMLIAGAFGVWTVHFATEAESLRRISLLVDRLNDVRDAILAVDRQGKIIGMNAAAEDCFGKERGQDLLNLCPGIEKQEFDDFLNSDSITEREYTFSMQGEPTRTLRFRIQPPVSGISLLLVSDITRVAAARARQRREATLHLAAHMAQGIANDFNDLLCGISGHASLLLKPGVKSDNLQHSATAIRECADRGIWLARQLTQLSQGETMNVTAIALDTVRHVENGIELLTANLDPSWKIESKLKEAIAPVNIPAAQIEHIILSLGLIVAETAHASNAVLHITLRKPNKDEHIKTQTRIAGILEIGCQSAPLSTTTNANAAARIPENGVISSLVETLIVQAGGAFVAIPDGRKANLFRIFLPEIDAETIVSQDRESDTLAIGLEAYTAGWHALLCMDASHSSRAESYFHSKGIHTVIARNEDVFLQTLASQQAFDVIFIQPDLLGQHFASFLPILKRISPEAAVVLTTDKPNLQTPEYVITLSPKSPMPQWIHAMVDARSRKKILPPTES